jgi:hypothetical protein
LVIPFARWLIQDPQRVHLPHSQEQILILRVQSTYAFHGAKDSDGERTMTMFTLGGSANLFPIHSDPSGYRAKTIHANYAANQAVRANEWPGFFQSCILRLQAEDFFRFAMGLSFQFLSN